MQISAIPASAPVVPAASEPTINPATDPVTPAEPATPTASTPTVSTPAAPPSKFLQKLASGHFNPVADLRHRMRLAQEIKDADLTLPEPAAPKGHGKAYAKFLAAYRAMTTSSPPSAPEPSTGATTTTEPAAPTPINIEA